MSDALYDQAIKSLAAAAHGRGRLAAPTASVTLDNALCGDRVTVDLAIDAGVVVALGHETRGCLLCRASASMLGLRAPGATVEELRALPAAARAMLLSGAEPGAPAGQRWPELAAFAPLAAHRSRHACLTLALDAASAAVGAEGADRR